MKQTLQLKLSQHLTLTPQLQQSIRLLQLSTLELNAEVERMLQENPLLEKAEADDEAPPPSDRARTAAPQRNRSRAPSATTRDATPSAPRPSDDGDARRRRRPRRFRGLFVGGDRDWGSGSSRDDDDDFSPQQVAASSLRDHLLRPARACSTCRCATGRSSRR